MFLFPKLEVWTAMHFKNKVDVLVDDPYTGITTGL